MTTSPSTAHDHLPAVAPAELGNVVGDANTTKTRRDSTKTISRPAG